MTDFTMARPTSRHFDTDPRLSGQVVVDGLRLAMTLDPSAMLMTVRPVEKEWGRRWDDDLNGTIRLNRDGDTLFGDWRFGVSTFDVALEIVEAEALPDETARPGAWRFFKGRIDRRKRGV
jgi:hypothetical protein